MHVPWLNPHTLAYYAAQAAGMVAWSKQLCCSPVKIQGGLTVLCSVQHAAESQEAVYCLYAHFSHLSVATSICSHIQVLGASNAGLSNSCLSGIQCLPHF